MYGIPEAVANGAQMLDQALPGWYRLINLDTLKLESCEKCVCGQLGRSLGWQLFPNMEAFPEEFGFDMPFAAAREVGNAAWVWREMDEEWQKAITTRLGLDDLPNVEPDMTRELVAKENA